MLLDLPPETVDDIISFIPSTKDLLYLALSSRQCANLVIPNHIQYRTLRIHDPHPSLWTHLIDRADLACNIREVHIFMDRQLRAEAYPAAIVSSSATSEAAVDWKNETLLRNISSALRNMKRLKTFVWEDHTWYREQSYIKFMCPGVILEAVQEAPELEHLALGQPQTFWADIPTGLLGDESYPLQKLCHLTSLSLTGESWLRPVFSDSVQALLKCSLNLEYLELPMRYSHLSDVVLPRLNYLRFSGFMPVPLGSYYVHDDTPIATFLSAHPSIKELHWYPSDEIELSRDALPALKRFQGGSQVLIALEATDISRQIHSINVVNLRTDEMANLRQIDKGGVRRLKIDTPGPPDSMKKLAAEFHGVVWLSASTHYYPRDRPVDAPLKFCLADWLDILPCFGNLEVFRCDRMLTAGVKREKVHEFAGKLGRLCPKLRQIDEFHNTRMGKGCDPQRTITIEREYVDGVITDVNIVDLLSFPGSWDKFDVFEGSFDD